MGRDDQFLLVLGGLAIALAAIAWLLFRIIAWLRKSASRYFYFELFGFVSMLGIGLLVLRAPPEAQVPLSVIGLGILLMGGWSLLVLLARRFHWAWLSPPLGRGKAVLRCSFCNKSQRDVAKLIAGPNVHICDECVGICRVILSEDSGPPEAPQPEPTAPAT